jgi:hypothetical protein
MQAWGRLFFTWRAACAAALIILPVTAWSHAAGTSYLNVQSHPQQRSIDMVWDLDVQDLDWTVDLDLDGNGQVSWGEIEEQREAINALALRGIEIQRGSSACVLSVLDHALTKRADSLFVSLAIQGECAESGPMKLTSSLFFSQDASQRVLVELSEGGRTFNTVLSPLAPSWAQPSVPSVLATFARFVGQGVWHVWIGYDHIAFIVLLLLPSVLRGTSAGWTVASGSRPVARDLVGVVTAFTVAHSVTLSLAATQTIVLPERPVEIVIAASIVAAGLLNLVPGAAGARLPLAFGFGLMHGFGFANALAELETSGTRMVPMLAGFNVGVEIAQLAIVAVALPVLLRLRASTFYAARLMPAASLATAIFGAAWLAGRLP